MRSLFVLLTLLCAEVSFGQKSEFFKDFKFDSTYAVIGIGPHWKKSGDPLQRFWFIVNDSAGLDKLKKEWTFSTQVIGVQEENSFSIYITKNKKYISAGIINPTLSNIRTPDDWYEFDTTLLISLHQSNPLKYHTQKIIFKTAGEYEKYLDSAIKQPAFLFHYGPNFTFQGQFTITIDKTNKIPHPKGASEYLEKKFRKIVSKDKFHITYALDDYNLNHPDKMRMTIECSKLLFDSYKNEKFEIGQWQPLIISVKSFWRD